ncbi:MAG: alpha/beta hydrolase family protein [Terriglobia bacterium]
MFRIRRRIEKSRRGKARLLCLILFLPASLWSMQLAAAAQTVEEARSKDFYHYLMERGAEISRRTLSDVHDLKQWKKRRPELRRQLLYMLGLDPLPARTPLNAKVTGVIEKPDMRIEKVVYQSVPGLYVTGNLYIPRKGEKPFPTVLYLSGHYPDLYGAKVPYQRHAIWFAQHGYACLILDTLEFGEVPGIHHGLYDQNMWQWLSLGYTPAGVEVWNAMRGLDYLEMRPEVDAQRIAVTGESGGGAMTWYTAALDERVAVAVPALGTWTVGSQVALHGVEENCDCIYYPNIFQEDFSIVGALIAPRPLKIISARRDVMFPPAGYNAIYEKLRTIYALYGAEEKIEAFDQDTGHGDNVPLRAQSATWIQRWLKGDQSPYEDGQFVPTPGAQLACLFRPPADAVNYRIHNQFIPVATPREWKSAPAWRARRKQLLSELREKVFRAFPASPGPLDAVLKPNSDTWANRYADVFDVTFSSEPLMRVSGLLFRPKDTTKPHPALIYVKGRSDSISSVDFDELLPVLGKFEVLVLYPRATDFPIDDRQWVTLERTSELLGTTIESMQVWDIMRAVDYMATDLKVDPASISLYGKGDMGILALYAAIMDSRPGRVILSNPPVTHWSGPPLLNILRVTDIPEAAALLAPRELVSLTPTGRSLDYTAALYRLTGNQKKFRKAGSLPEAMKVWEQR